MWQRLLPALLQVCRVACHEVQDECTVDVHVWEANDFCGGNVSTPSLAFQFALGPSVALGAQSCVIEGVNNGEEHWSDVFGWWAALQVVTHGELTMMLYESRETCEAGTPWVNLVQGCEDSTTWVEATHSGWNCAFFVSYISYCSDNFDAAGVSAATACPASCNLCPEAGGPGESHCQQPPTTRLDFRWYLFERLTTTDLFVLASLSV